MDHETNYDYERDKRWEGIVDIFVFAVTTILVWFFLIGWLGPVAYIIAPIAGWAGAQPASRFTKR